MPYDASTGFSPETFDQIFTLYQGAARTALGSDVDLGGESPLGQLLGFFAMRDMQIQERIVALANGLSRQRAVGNQLDDLFSLLGITRRDATRSTVTATLGGAPGATVRGGTRAATGAGDYFRLRADAVIGAGGTVAAEMEAVETGPVEAAPGALSRVVDVVTGWETVTNAAAALLGRDREPTPAYRMRGALETDRNAVAHVRAIAATILDAGASDVIVRHNNGDDDVTVRGVTVKAHGVLAVVVGASDQQVGDALAESVPAGIATGIGTVTVMDTVAGPVQFSRPTDIPVTVEITLELGTEFPGDGSITIRSVIVSTINSLSTGEPVDANQLVVAVYAAVPAGTVRVVGTPSVRRTEGGAAVDTKALVALNERLRVSPSAVTVTI